MRYRMLRDPAAPEPGQMRWIIKTGRRLVGSVRRAEDGVLWVGRIGEHTALATGPETAFREVAARALGFANLSALRAQNSAVRAANRTRNGTIRRRSRRVLLTGGGSPAYGPIDDEPFSG